MKKLVLLLTFFSFFLFSLAVNESTIYALAENERVHWVKLSGNGRLHYSPPYQTGYYKIGKWSKEGDTIKLISNRHNHPFLEKYLLREEKYFVSLIPVRKGDNNEISLKRFDEIQCENFDEILKWDSIASYNSKIGDIIYSHPRTECILTHFNNTGVLISAINVYN